MCWLHSSHHTIFLSPAAARLWLVALSSNWRPSSSRMIPWNQPRGSTWNLVHNLLVTSIPHPITPHYHGAGNQQTVGCLRFGTKWLKFYDTYTFTPTKLKGFQFVHPSVRLSTKSCPLCIFDNNTGHMHFIYVHVVNQLQKVCRVSRFFYSKIWIFAYICFVLFCLLNDLARHVLASSVCEMYEDLS